MVTQQELRQQGMQGIQGMGQSQAELRQQGIQGTITRRRQLQAQQELQKLEAEEQLKIKQYQAQLKKLQQLKESLATYRKHGGNYVWEKKGKHFERPTQEQITYLGEQGYRMREGGGRITFHKPRDTSGSGIYRTTVGGKEYFVSKPEALTETKIMQSKGQGVIYTSEGYKVLPAEEIRKTEQIYREATGMAPPTVRGYETLPIVTQQPTKVTYITDSQSARKIASDLYNSGVIVTSVPLREDVEAGISPDKQRWQVTVNTASMEQVSEEATAGTLRPAARVDMTTRKLSPETQKFVSEYFAGKEIRPEITKGTTTAEVYKSKYYPYEYQYAYVKPDFATWRMPEEKPISLGEWITKDLTPKVMGAPIITKDIYTVGERLTYGEQQLPPDWLGGVYAGVGLAEYAAAGPAFWIGLAKYLAREKPTQEPSPQAMGPIGILPPAQPKPIAQTITETIETKGYQVGYDILQATAGIAAAAAWLKPIVRAGEIALQEEYTGPFSFISPGAMEYGKLGSRKYTETVMKTMPPTIQIEYDQKRLAESIIEKFQPKYNEEAAQKISEISGTLKQKYMNKMMAGGNVNEINADYRAEVLRIYKEKYEADIVKRFTGEVQTNFDKDVIPYQEKYEGEVKGITKKLDIKYSEINTRLMNEVRTMELAAIDIPAFALLAIPTAEAAKAAGAAGIVPKVGVIQKVGFGLFAGSMGLSAYGAYERTKAELEKGVFQAAREAGISSVEIGAPLIAFGLTYRAISKPTAGELATIQVSTAEKQIQKIENERRRLLEVMQRSEERAEETGLYSKNSEFFRRLTSPEELNKYARTLKLSKEELADLRFQLQQSPRESLIARRELTPAYTIGEEAREGGVRLSMLVKGKLTEKQLEEISGAVIKDYANKGFPLSASEQFEIKRNIRTLLEIDKDKFADAIARAINERYNIKITAQQVKNSEIWSRTIFNEEVKQLYPSVITQFVGDLPGALSKANKAQIQQLAKEILAKQGKQFIYNKPTGQVDIYGKAIVTQEVLEYPEKISKAVAYELARKQVLTDKMINAPWEVMKVKALPELYKSTQPIETLSPAVSMGVERLYPSLPKSQQITIKRALVSGGYGETWYSQTGKELLPASIGVPKRIIEMRDITQLGSGIVGAGAEFGEFKIQGYGFAMELGKRKPEFMFIERQGAHGPLWDIGTIKTRAQTYYQYAPTKEGQALVFKITKKPYWKYTETQTANIQPIEVPGAGIRTVELAGTKARGSQEIALLEQQRIAKVEWRIYHRPTGEIEFVGGPEKFVGIGLTEPEKLRIGAPLTKATRIDYTQYTGEPNLKLELVPYPEPYGYKPGLPKSYQEYLADVYGRYEYIPMKKLEWDIATLNIPKTTPLAIEAKIVRPFFQIGYETSRGISLPKGFPYIPPKTVPARPEVLPVLGMQELPSTQQTYVWDVLGGLTAKQRAEMIRPLGVTTRPITPIIMPAPRPFAVPIGIPVQVAPQLKIGMTPFLIKVPTEIKTGELARFVVPTITKIYSIETPVLTQAKVPVQEMIQVPIEVQTLIPIQVPVQAEIQIPVQIQAPIQVKELIIIKPPIQVKIKPIVPVPWIPIIPEFEGEEPEKKAEKKGIKRIKAWIPFIMKRGKWKAISPPIEKSKAIRLGEQITLTTLAARFKITPSKQEIEGEEKTYVPSPEKFRTFKIVRGRKVPLQYEWIEKKTHRLKPSPTWAPVQRARAQYGYKHAPYRKAIW